MKKLFVSVLITFSTLFSYSQIYRGLEADDKVSGAEKVWIKEGDILPSYIKLSYTAHFHHNNLMNWLTETFELDSRAGLQLVGVQKGLTATRKHYRYLLTWEGNTVHNAMFIVHTDDEMVYAINGNLFREISPANTFSLSENQALDRALQYYSSNKYMWELHAEEALLKAQTGNPDTSYYPVGKLIIIPDYVSDPTTHFMAWKFNIYAHNPVRRGEVFVDAQSGRIIFENKLIRDFDTLGTAVTKYSGTQPITTDYHNNMFRLRESGRGQGIETYNMQNGTNYSAAVDFLDSNNYWNNVNAQKNEVATDAHWGTEMTYDYFFTRHNRNSIDDNGFKLRSYVHYGNNYVNAFWDGQRMTYGDGNNNNIHPLVALDIVAHEITHGLTSRTANLIYLNESGAINESFSDIFGTSVEFFAKPSAANWTVGENIGITLRSMSNPKAHGHPNCYLGVNYYIGTNDYGGVHSNCGVLNYWFYLLSQGGSGTNDLGNPYSVTGISIDSAARIAFRMLTTYLINTSGYEEARFYGILSATDLYGACSPEAIATTNALHAVGIGPAYVPGVSADFSSPLIEFCAPPVSVSFTNLSLNSNNFTWHFGDGNTSTDLHPTHVYTSTGNFTVKLVADGGSCGRDSLEQTAFVSIDPSNPCPHNMPNFGTQTLTLCKGRLFDSGGPAGNYPDNRTVTTVIAPPGASEISLNFLKFHFESGYDYLHIFDGPNSSSPKIGSFDGSNLPGTNGVVNSTGGSITLVQQSDQAISYEGFELLWECTYPNAPPLAMFMVSDTITCSGEVRFIDRSTNGPTSWYWEFGDGNISTNQHPVHTYTTAGNYSVTLSVSNAIGHHTSLQSTLIIADIPESPAVVHQANCGPTSFTLYAPVQKGTTHWFESQSSNTIVASGNTLQTDTLLQSESWWVENRIPQQEKFTGKYDNTGAGAFFTANAIHYLVFDIIQPIRLKTVKVYAQNTANRTITLRNSSGNIISSRQINIPAGESRITLDFDIPPGNNYRLACSGSNRLYRNSGGIAYPYEINGVVNIKHGSASTDPTGYYYYFYDWEIQEDDCNSMRYEINAFISHSPPSAAFSYTKNDPLVHFTDQSSNKGICFWDFGDGSTFIGSNPTYTYKVNGTYTVKMLVDNGCGLDSSFQQITIVGTNVDPPPVKKQISLFPNPTTDNITLSGNLPESIKEIMLFDIRGRLIFHKKIQHPGGEFNESIDMSSLDGGVYIIRISNPEQSEMFKVIKN